MSQRDEAGQGVAAAHRRQGPRPLALHLAMANLAWTSSQLAWPLWKSGSLPSNLDLASLDLANPGLAARSEKLRQSLAPVAPEDFSAALRRAIADQQRALLAGIQAYRAHPYRRTLADPPCLWTEGSSRLLDYGAVDKRGRAAWPVLVVPSLINRAYVLDLMADRSLLRWLARQGLRPLLLDWGPPGPVEREFALEDYVAGRLERALERVLGEDKRPPLVLGYCMGGVLALALALRRRAALSGLLLLATPWDFHAGPAAQGPLLSGAADGLGPLMEALGELPVDAIQGLFAGLDPMLAQRKFSAFAKLPPDSPRAAAFVALEDWLNDGVPLAAPVARECLKDWYGANVTGRGVWRIAGQTVNPEQLDLPTLCVIPSRDRIVPPGSAAALARALPNSSLLEPPLGHIGMVVSTRARDLVWRPMADWIDSGKI